MVAHNRLKLVGKQFGRLLVIRDVGNRIDSRGEKESMWECQCDCGNIKTIMGANLRSGDAISCGCYNKERTAAMNRISPSEFRVNRVFSSYRQAAHEKNREFELTKKDVEKLIDLDCYYCGCSPSNTHVCHGHKITYQGIDRLNNAKGYVPDNVVPCCIVCNKMKKALSHDGFLLHIHRIASRFETESPQADFHYEVCGGVVL